MRRPSLSHRHWLVLALCAAALPSVLSSCAAAPPPAEPDRARQACGDSKEGNCTTTSWSCDGKWGTRKAEDGDYYATAFGCWKDASGTMHQDPGDNCIPACLSQARSSGLCANMTGPTCEATVRWFAADAGRFGCLARLRVSNPENGKSLVVVALDHGPSCAIEKRVSHAAIDLSYPANDYLFGSEQGISDKAKVHVVEVDPGAPLGPVD
jgi:hypothetical protein